MAAKFDIWSNGYDDYTWEAYDLTSKGTVYLWSGSNYEKGSLIATSSLKGSTTFYTGEKTRAGKGECTKEGQTYYFSATNYFNSVHYPIGTDSFKNGYKPKPPSFGSHYITGKTHEQFTFEISISNYDECNIRLYNSSGQLLYDDDNRTRVTYTSLSPSTEYQVVVEAWNSESSEVAKKSVYVKTEAPPGPPSLTNVEVVNRVSGTGSDVYPWVQIKANASNMYSYVVEVWNSSESYDRIENYPDGAYVSEVFENLNPKTYYNYKIMAAGYGGQLAQRTGSFTTYDLVPNITYMQITDIKETSVSVWVSSTYAYDYKWYINGVYQNTTTAESTTITGLKGSTQYTVGCIARNKYGSSPEVTENFRTKQGKFYWTGGSASNGFFTSTDKFQKLTVKQWNDFMEAIKGKYMENGGGHPPLPSISSGMTLSATSFNQVLSALRGIRGIGALPSNVEQKQPIQAEEHINKIVKAFNASIK